MGKLANLLFLDLSKNRIRMLPASLLTHANFMNFTNNQWLVRENKSLVSVNAQALSDYAHQELPRSLLTICGRYLQNTLEQAKQDQRNELEAAMRKLPEELRMDNLNKTIKKCRLVDGKRIIYFNAAFIPAFYWDRPILTSQDVKASLNLTRDNEVYLIPEADLQADEQNPISQ